MVADAARGQVTGVEVDPRVERSRRVILEAALGELVQVGYGAMTIERVAARAGVGKSTIYRHWPGKLELVEDAFRTLKASFTVPPGGSFRERVIGLLQQVAGLVAESTYSACMPALIDAAERDPTVRDFHNRFSAERRAVLVNLLQEGVESGDLPGTADAELLADALVGPILLRRLMMAQTCDPSLIPALVDQVLPIRSASANER